MKNQKLRPMIAPVCLLVLINCALGVQACWHVEDIQNLNSGTDSDADSDTDSNIDTDTESNVDTDTEIDTATDTEIDTAIDTGDPSGSCNLWKQEAISETAGLADVDSIKIGIGPDDKLHAFYSTPVALIHAVKQEDMWIESYIGPGYVYSFAATVDVDGSAHVVYYNDGIEYKNNSSGDWASQGKAVTSCMPSSMLLDDFGTLHVAGNGAEQLCYGTRSKEGIWTFKYLGSAYPRGTSIIVDFNKVYITYYGPGLYHISNESGIWTKSHLGIGGIDNEMVMQGGGTLIIAHSESPLGSVILTIGASDYWTYDVLQESNELFHTGAPSIDLDEGNGVHMVYPREDGSGCLRYGTASDIKGIFKSVDAVPDAVSAELALNSRGIPHIVYWSNSSSLPMHAWDSQEE